MSKKQNTRDKSNEQYFEEDTKYFSDGEMRIRQFYPSRMSPYALGKTLHYNIASRPERFEEYFVQYISSCVSSILNERNLQSQKPTTQEKQQHKELVAACIHIVRANISFILQHVFSKRYEYPQLPPTRYTPSYEIRGHGDGEVNRAIFNSRLQNTLNWFLFTDQFEKVLQDFILVQSVKNDPAQFHTLELLCKKTLQHWIQTDHVGGMDNADQEQEGRIIVWKCAQSYNGRNFSRFSSMVKQALHNKSSNLRAYHTADKRRINKLSVPCGITDNPKESYFAQKISEVSHTAWALAQNNGVQNPFDSLSLQDLFELCPKRSCDLLALDAEDVGWTDRREITADNFPHENEFNIVVEKRDDAKEIAPPKTTEKQGDIIPF